MLLRLIRVGSYLHIKGFKNLSRLIYKLQFFMFNCAIPHTTKIGENVVFAYGGIGVVIHARAKIGNNCNIGQGITIGGRSKYNDVPVIGDNVYIGPGARILGPIVIGNNSIVAPNSVVLENVEDNSIVAGVPARVIRTNINPEDYI
ncbi:serine O-acetyltransferase [Vibrio owensii]|uniref:Serine acetyltransferase n=1 Tax=Vibrio owensii CAIM 1854 = LMG 25443 TaxID=1229493 RepID=A0A0C1YZQ2_9VIBR|nr:serine acetyltransferase [Vibrio owensii]KIF50400.1 serine acetyltransferase [Vibrio owensii CAIM 1854 = LMG 25443]